MKIDQLSVAVRPRSDWEAADLGIAMLRKWWRDVYKPVLIILGLFLALVAIPFHDSPGWVIFLVWWLKPLWDRIPLQVLSRAMFGTKIGTWEVLKTFFTFARPGLFLRLTLLRFGPSRGVTLPVLMLEGLKGKRRRQRQSMIVRQTIGASFGVGSMMVVIEWFTLVFGIFAAIFLIVPSNFHEHLSNPDDFFAIFFGSEHDTTLARAWVCVLIYTLAVVIIEPMYVAACFGVYLNCRTRIEGWDLELTFRRLAERVSKVAQAALLCVVLLLGFSSQALQAQDRKEIQAQMEEILEDPVFGHERVETRYFPKFNQSSKPRKDAPQIGSIGMILAEILRFLLYGLLVALIVFIVFAIIKRLKRVPLGDSKPEIQPRAMAEVRLGAIIEADTLPEDILKGAREAWSSGEQRLALSYLFRGALFALASAGRINIGDDATEGECVNQVKRVGPKDLVAYFGKLTTSWQSAAYAHRMPSDLLFDELCDGWRKHFEVIAL